MSPRVGKEFLSERELHYFKPTVMPSNFKQLGLTVGGHPILYV
jgi:hypothetical protein